jgi:hypothetical protein
MCRSNVKAFQTTGMILIPIYMVKQKLTQLLSTAAGVMVIVYYINRGIDWLRDFTPIIITSFSFFAVLIGILGICAFKKHSKCLYILVKSI